MATYLVTVAGAGDNSGDSWANAMALADFITDVTSASASDLYWLYTGTYTLVANLICSISGAQGTEIEIRGCEDQGTPPTPATGANRPLFACGANGFRYGDNTRLRNFRFTTSHANGVYSYNGNNSTVNCESVQSGNSSAFESNSTYDIYEGCDGTAGATGQAFYASGGSGQKYINCYGHDTREAWYVTGGRAGLLLVNCIVDTCTRNSIYIGSTDGVAIINCTIYGGSDTGIDISTGDAPCVLNTTITSCTTNGAIASTACGGLWDWNNYNSNGTDRTGVPTGANDIAVAPEFIDAAGGDFSWPLGGNLQDAGKGMTLGVG